MGVDDVGLSLRFGLVGMAEGFIQMVAALTEIEDRPMRMGERGKKNRGEGRWSGSTNGEPVGGFTYAQVPHFSFGVYASAMTRLTLTHCRQPIFKPRSVGVG